MEKITAYSVLNRDYTDKLRNRLVLKPGSTKTVTDFSAITYPIVLLSIYGLFNNYRVVTIDMMGDLLVRDVGTGICKSNKISVIKEISSLDLVFEEVWLDRDCDNIPTRISNINKHHHYKEVVITGKYGDLVANLEYDFSPIISCKEKSIINVTGNNCNVNSSGMNSRLFIGGSQNRVCANGSGTCITSIGKYNYISASGPECTICSGGDRTEISVSNTNAKIGALGNNTNVSITGRRAQVYCSGDNSRVSSVGEKSIIKCTGENCIISAVSGSVVSASLGSWITLTKTKTNSDGSITSEVITWKVDGECIFPDVFYKFNDLDFEPINEADIKKYLDYGN